MHVRSERPTGETHSADQDEDPGITGLSVQDLVQVSSGSRGGPGGLGPLAPQDFCKIMQFSGNFQGRTNILSKVWAQGPSGVKTPLGPPDQNPGFTPDSELSVQGRIWSRALCQRGGCVARGVRSP